jgi:alkanesulfonate monooxygenase SsuD/methylene tetrahydromethanopterin reductase-like flavin-dependent oxidoreductase (luciferase family)
MRFSVYSEMQYWGGKAPERLYAEVAEQIVHADRLGYSSYAINEHLFFPKFSLSPDPQELFADLVMPHFETSPEPAVEAVAR